MLTITFISGLPGAFHRLEFPRLFSCVFIYLLGQIASKRKRLKMTFTLKKKKDIEKRPNLFNVCQNQNQQP